MKRFGWVCALLAAGIVGAHAAEPGRPLKIGVLTDVNGYTGEIGGRGSVVAATMAAEDFGGKLGDRKIEIVFADHQNKPDIGSAIARRWYDVDGVDLIVDVPNSAVTLAVQEVARNANRVVIHSAASTPLLTGKACSATGIHWARDTYAIGKSIGEAVFQQGGDTWFFITADYAFGHAIEQDVGRIVTQSGGKVLGSVRHPANTSDFASFLLQAQASKAKIVALANAGGDTITSIKQAAEFGLTSAGQRLAAMSLFISDVHSLGLKAAGGLQLTDLFYWDLNDRTRAWSRRFFAQHGRMPTSVQADVYNAISHYLKAAATTEPGDGIAVVRTMKAMPVSGPLLEKGSIREDGRLVRDLYLFQVKTPEQSKEPWDYYTVLRTIPGESLVRPLADSDCPLVKKS